VRGRSWLAGLKRDGAPVGKRRFALFLFGRDAKFFRWRIEGFNFFIGIEATAVVKFPLLGLALQDGEQVPGVTPFDPVLVAKEPMAPPDIELAVNFVAVRAKPEIAVIG
jgi:hypothetical protein